MRHFVRCVWLGLGPLSGFGPHPGTVVLAVFVALGAIAGIERGLLGAAVGAALMLVCFGPFYLLGAYARGTEYLRRWSAKK